MKKGRLPRGIIQDAITEDLIGTAVVVVAMTLVVIKQTSKRNDELVS